jgi:hypothetical protein
MGDDICTSADELAADYALYGTAGWEELQVFDSRGKLWRRDFHAEAGLSETLVRIRWGGARHRDRYRWATWTGRLRITGSAVHSVIPWAATHPEQAFDSSGPDITWHTRTYGGDIGVVVSLADLAAARLQVDTTVLEDDVNTSLTVTGVNLMSARQREIAVGGLNLTLRVERIAELATLPETVDGRLMIALPPGDSAVYLRARQADGHQVWTSPLFLSRKSESR